MGSDPDQFPPEMLAVAVPLVPVFRRGRPFFDAGCRWPTGGGSVPEARRLRRHHGGFDAMWVDLARRIGASQVVVEGAGHEIQFTGDTINQALLSLSRSVSGQGSLDVPFDVPGRVVG